MRSKRAASLLGRSGGALPDTGPPPLSDRAGGGRSAYVNRPLRVLIVEDSEDDAELVCFALREGGYEPVFDRVDNAERMSAALARDWDLVIADHTMPTFDAPRALRMLQESGKDLPFIIVSGSINEEIAVSAMRAGAHDFIMKDRLTRLVPAVARELREAQGRSERRRAERELKVLEARYQDRLQDQAKRLQILSRRLLDAQETERRAVARELHDEIGQVLTAVKIHLQALEQPARNKASASLTLRETIDIVEHAIQLVRDRSMDLRPALLDDFGLVPAIRWYVERHAARAGFKVELNADPHMARVPTGLETACFRIIQEAVTNVMRHAKATEIDIDIENTSDGVRFSIRDNGVGFDVSAARRRALLGGSIGIAGMQERVEFLGGTLDIASAPGTGTHIEVFLPLSSPDTEG